MTKIAFIPARSGSQRFPKKNYQDFYMGYNLSKIMALKCINSLQFDRIVVTSDDINFFDDWTDDKWNNIEFYHREVKYATSEASVDMVMTHLFENFECDQAFFMINMNPFQTKDDITSCVEALESADTVIPVNKMQKQAIFKGSPINYDPKVPHAQTQDLEPYYQWSYSTFGWKRSSYLNAKSKGHTGMLVGDVAYPEVSYKASFAIKTESDFNFYKSIASYTNLF
tara:strand:- start:914 stop:1591 length:678 start_codon:yes stop_codon:yes gene_type:complete